MLLIWSQSGHYKHALAMLAKYSIWNTSGLLTERDQHDDSLVMPGVRVAKPGVVVKPGVGVVISGVGVLAAKKNKTVISLRYGKIIKTDTR